MQKKKRRENGISARGKLNQAKQCKKLKQKEEKNKTMKMKNNN